MFAHLNMPIILAVAMMVLVAVCLLANIRLKRPISEKIILALISAIVAVSAFFAQGK